MKKVLLEHQWLMARGRTPPNRQSFRGCPNVIALCLLRGYKGRFDGTCGRLPVSRRIGKTRQIAFVGDMQKANFLRRDQGLEGVDFGALGDIIMAKALGAFSAIMA